MDAQGPERERDHQQTGQQRDEVHQVHRWLVLEDRSEQHAELLHPGTGEHRAPPDLGGVCGLGVPEQEEARREREPAPDQPSHDLSHMGVGPDGRSQARMVDVGSKAETRRSALARARVELPPGLGAVLRRGEGPKGPLEEVVRVAGILGAKRTADLIPMCHPLGLDHVEVELRHLEEDLLEIRCRASCMGRTGVEMEALTGASLAALTVVDMVKAAGKGVRIRAVELLEKTGGKSGTWRRPGAEEAPGPQEA